jgi:hypothetical protein
MPQFPTPNVSPDQLAEIRALLPVAGDPPAVRVQKQAALKEVITRLRGSGVAMSDPATPTPAPGLFGGGRPGGGGATGSWNRDTAVDTAVDQAASNMMRLTDPPQFKQATITDETGRALTPPAPPAPRPASRPAPTSGGLNLSDYQGTPAAAPPPAPAPAAPAPSAPTPAGASLNLGAYTGPAKTSLYNTEPEDEEEAAPAAAPARPGSLNFSDYLGGGGTAPAPGAARGGARPAAKNPPAPARASVPKSYLGPDVEAQMGATFAGQPPAAPLGSATGPAEGAFAIGTLAPVLQRQAIEDLLSQVDVAPQVGGAPVALGDAPPPPAQPAGAPDPEVAAMVEQLLAEARRSPTIDTFRSSKGRKGRGSYFGGR